MVLFIVIALLLFQWLFILWNLYHYPRLKRNPSSSLSDLNSALPISVLIPARNEERHIAACLDHVFSQRMHPSETLVYDDQSTDHTASIVESYAEHHRSLRLLSTSPKPPGWIGKSYACHRLAEEARGEWLLFLDAYARLEPEALELAIDYAHRQGTGLVTGFPHQRTGSWLERTLVPMLMFTVLSHLPVKLVRDSSNPRYVAAHGAFMLIHRDSYTAAGGHASICEHLVDDMQLAAAVKRAGAPVSLLHLGTQVHMRMYTDAAGVWNGLRKSLYPGLQRRGGVLSAVLLWYAALYLVPHFWLLCAAWVAGDLSWPALIGCLLGVLIKATVDRSQGQSVWLALFYPLIMIVVIAAALSSWHAGRSGRGYVWKGRRYT